MSITWSRAAMSDGSGWAGSVARSWPGRAGPWPLISQS
jgi:hypothetical protein